MTTGTVKWFDGGKGYGFIAPDDGGRDVFIHASVLRRADIETLEAGQTVEFESNMNGQPGKVAAVNVEVVR